MCGLEARVVAKVRLGGLREPADDFVQPRHKSGPGLIRRGLDLVVRERSRRDAGREVGHARDSDDLGAHVPRRDGFVHGGHAHEVRAHRLKHPDLRRSFVAGAGHGRVHAILGQLADCVRASPLQTSDLGADPRMVAQSGRVHLGHIREPRTKSVIVLALERVLPKQVEVIAHEHQIAGLVGRVDAARGVGEDDRATAKTDQGAHRMHEVRHGVTLVRVAAALEGDDRLFSDRSAPEHSGVSCDSRDQEVRDLGVGNRNRIADGFRVSAQAGAEHQADRRATSAKLEPQRLDCLAHHLRRS